ncbi:hypothetical protein [Mycobacterium sp. E2462]|uniref:hypothetical protein n=1 Tax=Mycobacterium sp. E2462 TaxID=1834133 RepID=UPI0018D37214|nr:hypothetical protein [Mycobacterium sp. E2462]
MSKPRHEDDGTDSEEEEEKDHVKEVGRLHDVSAGKSGGGTWPENAAGAGAAARQASDDGWESRLTAAVDVDSTLGQQVRPNLPVLAILLVTGPDTPTDKSVDVLALSQTGLVESVADGPESVAKKAGSTRVTRTPKGSKLAETLVASIEQFVDASRNPC